MSLYHRSHEISFVLPNYTTYPATSKTHQRPLTSTADDRTNRNPCTENVAQSFQRREKENLIISFTVREQVFVPGLVSKVIFEGCKTPRTTIPHPVHRSTCRSRRHQFPFMSGRRRENKRLRKLPPHSRWFAYHRITTNLPRHMPHGILIQGHISALSLR